MKTLQIISGALTSGAGRGALALYGGLKQLGVDSRVLGVLEKTRSTDVVVNSFSNWRRIPISIQNRLYHLRLRRRHGTPDALFHPISHGLNPQHHPLYDWADVVHIQSSLATMLGPAFFRTLPCSGKPVLFTLRDMWLFTGGCHFSGSCREFERGCGRCAMLEGDASYVTTADVALKRATLPDVATFVAISESIATEARKSTALGDADIRVILNSVDTDSFAPIDRLAARRSLGLSDTDFVVAYGALILSEFRKGAEVMKIVMREFGTMQGIHWAVFGGQPFVLPENATWFGMVQDDRKLNLILSAADVFVMPSLQETFGKTTAEALAAGTPVIAFDQTPATEIVTHGKSGWIVPHGDADAIIAAIKHAQQLDPEVLSAMGRSGRDDVLSRHAPTVVARAHLTLYEEVLARHQSRNPAPTIAS